MVERDLRRRGIGDARVLAAFGAVPRHRFVAPGLERLAYADRPLPTCDGQTVSQPYIVACMTEALDVRPGVRVLELGTGSGYQTAILAHLGAEVWSIESSPTLWRQARARLCALGYEAHVACGDGTLGWAAAAPFDRILATGSLPRPNPTLLAQIRKDGLFVGPVGGLRSQRLVRITVDPSGLREETLTACAFVPLVGAGGWRSVTEQET
jgi:protein-L-isoaspartate(D-aspartate) O-methyltransferase